MFPAAFDYLRAHSVDEAIAGLQPHGPDARILAGGQSLIPAMRFRLARPAVLVDINPIKELSYLREEGGYLRIGATARDATLEAFPRLAAYPLLRDVSAVVADPVVRHMGTVVGSLCHNDPSGDWPAAALAGNAQVVIRGAMAERIVSIDDFVVDSFTTAVGDGEMAVEVRFPTPSARTAGAYEKIERKVGDFATAAAAVRITLDEQGICSAARVAITALGPVAMRVTRAEQLLIGQKPTDEVIRAAAAEASHAATPNADARGSVEYKKELARVLVARALHTALRRLSA